MIRYLTVSIAKWLSHIALIFLMFISIKGSAQVSVTATAGTVGPTAYTTLRDAFIAINGGTHQGSIVVSITANTTETASCILNRSGSGSASYTSVLIKPAASTTPAISGAVASTGLIKILGDNVTIDGSNTSGGTTQDLAINNTSTTGPTVIWMGSTGTTAIQNVTIKNCIITNGANTASAIVLSDGATLGTAGYFNTITINNNTIRRAYIGMYLIAVPTGTNGNTTIVSGNFLNATGAFAIRRVGIYSQGINGTGGAITGNAIGNFETSVAETKPGIWLATNNSNTNVTNNIISNISITSLGSSIYDGPVGIWVTTTTGGSNLNLSGNSISNLTSNGFGTAIGIGIPNTSPASGGATVKDNKIADIRNNYTGGYGSNGILLSSGFTTANIDVYNNFVLNVSSYGSSGGALFYRNGWGIIADQGAGYKIHHNTINLNTNQTTGLSAALCINGITTTNAIALSDNIIANNQTSGSTRYGIYCGNANTIFSSIDYNDYYATSGNLGFIGGVARTTIAQIQTGFGSNLNSITLNPTFTSATDLHLQNVSANAPLDAGTFISSPSITTDIDGDSRTAAPTMGADEFASSNNITYTLLASTCSTGDVTLNPVTINSTVGVPTTGTLVPRVYFRKNTGPWFSQPGTLVSGTGVAGDWSFVISAAAMGGIGAADVISYYVIAQTTAGTIFGNPSAGLAATDVNTVTTHPTTPNTYNITAVALSGLVTSVDVCYNGSAAQTASFSYSGTPGTPNQYTLTWSPAGPTNVAAFTSLSGGAISVNVPAGTAANTYTGTLTIRNSTTTCSTTYTLTLTVHPLPSAITGSLNLCVGGTTTLASATTGGSWTSSTSSVATVGLSTGVVSGSGVGTSTISYTATTGCATSAVVTVNTVASIAGPAAVCVNSTITLTNSTSGGTWSSSCATILTVGATTGIVTGVSSGVCTVTYTSPLGCIATRSITVNPLPAPITGTPTLCTGGTTTLSTTSTGVSWSSSSPTIATVSAGGIVTGITAGYVDIVCFFVGTGCSRSTTVTVDPSPTAIIGSYTMCAGSTTTFTNSTTGGSWSSSSSIITIGSSSGIAVAGLSSGVANISYVLSSTGCFRTAAITVNPLPGAIGGSITVCPGTTGTLTSSTGGGTWSGGAVGIATVTPTGIVTGIAEGTATVTYTVSTGCFTTGIVTVNPAPAAITGSATVCVGYTTTLASATAGGTWSTSAGTGSVIVSSAGVVTGVGAGTATVSYTAPTTGCYSTVVVTINSTPGAISGSLSVCLNQVTTLTGSPAGGTWSSSTPAIASADAASGAITGNAVGTSTITYALGSGCISMAVVTVLPLPAAITGPVEVCVGRSITLSTTSAGVTWSTSSAGIATVISGTGVVTGASAGTVTISAAFSSTGCFTTHIVTVNPLPTAILGTLAVCAGQTTALSNASPGGTWSSSNSAVANIDAATGVMTGGSVTVATTATITYTLPTGCIRTATATVNPLPSAVTSSSGTMAVCVGSTIVLTGTPTGGTWTSSTPAIATVGSSSGLVTGVTAGTTTITYTITTTGCYTVTTVTVNPLPSAITGTLTLCPGTTTTLSSASAGGVWSSGNLVVASVNSTTGVVTGNSAGVVTITCTLSGTGCRTTAVVTVNPLPGAITGTATVCQTQCTTLSSSTASGAWSTTPGTGSVTVTASGVVCGATAGTAIVSYTLTSTGCYQTRIVTVLPDPAVITGGLSVCSGSTTTLNNATAGGSWISSTISVATVNPSSGVVTGASVGTTVITYVLSSGCYSTAVVTVTSAPTVITGTMTVCEGSVTTLSSTPAGGTWSSSDPLVASVAASGNVTGVAGGSTATITYSLGTGCFKVAIVTVNVIPSAIAGTTAVCVGSSVTLSSSTSGGTWTSANGAVATVSSGGVVTGNSAGTVDISYTIANGCSRVAVVTVHPLPAVITGTLTVCQGQTTALSSATAGGTWSSADATIATVNMTTGVVTGDDDGTTTITYSLGTGCITTAVVTVLPLPDAIGGTLAVCSGLTTTLTDATAGGSWSSSNPAIAAIGATTGVVTAGTVAVATTATITYTLASTGCYITAEVTVNSLPAPIMGASGFCNLTTTTLTDATAGGTWSSADPSVAYFTDPTIGALTGATVGTVIVTYTLPTGCIDTAVRTTILAPYPITGSAEVCEGSCTTLGNTITGGTWTSDNSLIAPISTPGGVVCGISTGTTNITYELSNGCYSSWTQTVNPTPGAITGFMEVCAGLTTTLVNSLPSGGWTSSDITVAEADVATGIITGLTAGTATISYMMATGCLATAVVTVHPLPDAITGTAEVCVGLATTLASTAPGGTWSSSDIGIAVASAGGIITGNSSGTATITYMLPTGCIATILITVNPLPSAITGSFTVCEGSSTMLYNISPGGTWSSSDPSVASISSTGLVYGESAGEAVITYTLATGCIATESFTVNPVPSAIGGSLLVCTGFMSNLTNTIAGGVWSSGGPSSVATIHPLTGVVTGITPGTITVTYTLGTGCLATAVVTVSPLPPAITGTAQVCEASTTTLADAAPGGTWTSSDATIASVDALLGVVSGHTSGTATITYTIATGCINIRHVTVNPLPNAITGDTAVCEHFTTTLSNTTPGGAWNSSNTVVAGIGLTSGVVTGLSAGTTNISYTVVATGCLRSRVVTVHPTPQPIAGSPYICIGSSRTFSNLMTGGSWLSSNTAVATIGSASGIASGITLGTSVITYRMPVTGCYVTKTATVSPLPNVYTVTGGGNYCSGGTGVPVGLSGSQGGVSYLLSYGASATGYMTGTGAAISFGPMTVAGTYTVLATDAVSGCTRNMAGSATVTILPLVTPVVTINTGEGDSLCAGGPHLFRADTVHAGAAPTYTWRVNGVAVGVGQTYSFIPADGDVVRVTMNSTGLCASPTAVTDTMRVTILPQEMPMAFISADPGDTVCQFSLTTYSATATGGGTAPLYTWLVNGAAMGTGPSFSYVPEHNDVVNVLLESSYKCALEDSVYSGNVVMAVDSMIVPHITIEATPGLLVTEGQMVTLNTTVTHAGVSPTYQWKVNGIPVPGATNPTYTSTFNHYDSVTCMVTSDGWCKDITTFDWVFISVGPLGVSHANLGTDLMLLPNPNKGEFTIRGMLPAGNDQELTAEVTDMLGQVVYRGKFTSRNGRVEEKIQLTGTLANGMYMLNLRSQTDSKVFHFVMEQ